ncbi:MAG: microcin C ABC transporter permease YejB [Candidatus Azotimanducaceae bacterium]|uniref:Microcin C ABC transporter permease YejB n=1 Tax=OM182 bacterium TaxID=2510334 RepID=A0A520S3E8_9GAMM|nr:microcin ABC transporter permease [Gammaproteobacteria bacterium]RZO76995.1 MAG: microcin C ABC transporter permease YejB [OM182 bacterium]
MSSYIFRRVVLIFPTLIGILLVNFIIIQASPGGPVDQAISRIMGEGVAATSQIGGGGGPPSAGAGAPGGESSYEFARGLDPELIAELERQFGFDKPAHVRFLMMMKDYFSFEFGNSYYQDVPVVDLIAERLPVSLSLGLASLLIVYSVSVPLGIRKAVSDGTPFDIWTSIVILIGYAIPAFVLAMLLIIVFCGGEFFNWFPLRGLISDNYEALTAWEKIKDRIWHIAMPVTAMVAGSFATLTMLTKNSFLEEINKQYVLTARAKGLTPRRVLYGHVFRNAMLIVIAGFPAALLGMLFTGGVLIEVIFSLRGIGLLGFEAILTRDYPIVFATLFVFTLLGLITQLIADVTYMLVDPRIDFELREG